VPWPRSSYHEGAMFDSDVNINIGAMYDVVAGAGMGGVAR
jgi:hypothetical protein